MNGLRPSGLAMPLVLVVLGCGALLLLSMHRNLLHWQRGVRQDQLGSQAQMAAGTGWRWGLALLNDARELDARCRTVEPVTLGAESGTTRVGHPRSLAVQTNTQSIWMACDWPSDKAVAPGQWTCACGTSTATGTGLLGRHTGFSVEVRPTGTDGLLRQLTARGCAGADRECSHAESPDAIWFERVVAKRPDPESAWHVVVGSWSDTP